MRKDFGNIRLVRKAGERIVIGDPLNPTAIVSVDRIGATRVELLISADKSVHIYRDEVAMAMAADIKQAKERQ